MLADFVSRCGSGGCSGNPTTKVVVVDQTTKEDLSCVGHGVGKELAKEEMDAAAWSFNKEHQKKWPNG